MNDNDLVKSLANTLISQYGNDAEAVAMRTAAEYAAALNNDDRVTWAKVIVEINNMNNNPDLDG